MDKAGFDQSHQDKTGISNRKNSKTNRYRPIYIENRFKYRYIVSMVNPGLQWGG